MPYQQFVDTYMHERQSTEDLRQSNTRGCNTIQLEMRPAGVRRKRKRKGKGIVSKVQ